LKDLGSARDPRETRRKDDRFQNDPLPQGLRDEVDAFGDDEPFPCQGAVIAPKRADTPKQRVISTSHDQLPSSRSKGNKGIV